MADDSVMQSPVPFQIVAGMPSCTVSAFCLVSLTWRNRGSDIIYFVSPLLSLRSRTLPAFVWQPDLLMVVRYIYDCFPFLTV